MRSEKQEGSKLSAMITIVHILSDANRSGAPTHVLTLANGLKALDDGFQTVVIGPTGPIADDFMKAKVFYSVFDITSKFQRQRISKLRLHLEEVLADYKTDHVIIHCHGPRAGLFGRLATHTLPYPIVYTEHSWNKDYHLPNIVNEWFQLAALRYLDRYTTKTIGVSQAVVDFLLERKITSPDKIAKIYNGVAIPAKTSFIDNKPDQADAPNKTDNPDMPIVIGSVGSLTFQKNYSWLLRLFHGLLEEFPQLRLQIIGAGREEANLKQQAAKLKIADAVEFIGSVPHEKIADYFRKWRLYLQPSTNESFGLALIEAVAAGLPALGSDTGAVREVLGSETATFPLTDYTTARMKISQYLKDRDKRRQLWQQEFDHIQQFTVEKMVLAHQALYREIIDQQ